MDYANILASMAAPIEMTPSSTSYFSESQVGLDPRLFKSSRLMPAVRSAVLTHLFDFLDQRYVSARDWTSVWLAGSGVSHQWAADRTPGDLDCLIGIDYTGFRRANPTYKTFSDRDISQMLNDQMRTELWPETADFMGQYELTFYANVEGNISKIKPYAAYDLIKNDWLVEPQVNVAEHRPDWDRRVEADLARTSEILDRYSKALTEIHSATNPAARVNAEATLRLAIGQGVALFDLIHQGRKVAFSESGEGYLDWTNYRWQANKSNGVIQALQKLKDISENAAQSFEQATYGVKLPDTSTLIRRAASTQI
jgi:hypothetical protein